MAKQISRLGVIAGVLWEAFSGQAQRRTTVHKKIDDSNRVDSSNLANSSKLGSYQTAPLTDYRQEHRHLAVRIFAAVKAELQPHQARQYKGSYTFIGPESKEAIAKIIIYEHGVGKINGNWPINADGVYILTRLHGETDAPTVGVAPAHNERFTFRRVHEVDVQAAVQAVVAAVGRAERALTATAP